ncbi:cyclic nucleotide-binding domain-containing protein [Anaerosinus massiliensis]|uniref:cyclic nucleotide-binding domain-containing protein n=1 Tax=Massilibacillus massiliensis TaxID=1806837 RepID=UPI000DA63069|nr:cyclic nucleotide-binding domain-containing protein [Massilibacillus massiliensis]
MNNQNLKKVLTKKKSTEENFQVCIANTLEEKKAIYQFRYEVYVEEMLKYKLKLVHQDKELADEMDEWGVLIYVKNGEEVIGTARINIGKISDFPKAIVEQLSLKEFQEYCDNNADYQFATVTKLMVGFNYRSSSALYLMMSKGYELYMQKGVQFSFGGGNCHLLRLYEKMGYHRYGKNFEDFGYGLLSPIVMLTNDLNHFRTIRSPFFRIAKKKANGNSAEINWFHEKFTKRLGIVNSQLIKPDELWSILCQRFNALPIEVIEILRDLSVEEAKIFLHACSSIVQCAPGELITTQGDVSYSHYVLLSGSLKSLTFENPIREYTVPGQYFGANGLTGHNKHTEDIVTTSQAEILVLTGFAFPRFSNANLDIAHKIIKRSIALSRNTMIRFK